MDIKDEKALTIEKACTINVFAPFVRNVTAEDEKAVTNKKHINSSATVHVFHGVVNRTFKTKGNTVGLPKSFSKAVIETLSYKPFAPICIHSRSDEVVNGFPLIYFPEDLASHDISGKDWKSFIHDVNMACSFSDVALMGLDQILNLVSFGLSAYVISYYVEKYVDKAKFPIIKGFIEMWNRKFFNPRKTHVYFINPDEVAEQRAVSIKAYQQEKGTKGLFSKFNAQREWKKQHQDISSTQHSRLLLISL